MIHNNKDRLLAVSFHTNIGMRLMATYITTNKIFIGKDNPTSRNLNEIRHLPKKPSLFCFAGRSTGLGMLSQSPN